MARTEADKIAMSPLKVWLGQSEYKIQLLRTNAQREWRKQLVTALKTILENFQITTTDTKVFSGGLVSALLNFPDKVTDLLFAYAPDLDREKIMEESTEEQIVSAFGEVVGVAFPFLGLLGMMSEILRSELSSSPRVESLN